MIGRDFEGALERFLGPCDCFHPGACAHAEFAALKRIAAAATLQDAANIVFARAMNGEKHEKKPLNEGRWHDNWLQACNDLELAAEQYEGRA